MGSPRNPSRRVLRRREMHKLYPDEDDPGIVVCALCKLRWHDAAHCDLPDLGVSLSRRRSPLAEAI